MTVWEAITWNVARAAGFTAFGLLTLAVAVGLALSLKWQSPRVPRALNSELHNFLTLLSMVFVGVHVLAIAFDPFTHFGLADMLVPFVSTYRPVWMGLGIVALYLGIAIGISTWLRSRIGYALWRKLHVLTLGVYALAALHGIVVGTDTGSWWAITLYSASLLLVGTLVWQRCEKTVSSTQPTAKRADHIMAKTQRER